MAAGFEVRAHSLGQTAMFTIQALAATSWADTDLGEAQRALSLAYETASVELAHRIGGDAATQHN